MIRHAVIMAAGRGNRMRPLTDVLPKSMIPYKNDTLIGQSLQNLSGQVQYVHVTVGYKKAMLSQYLMEKGINSIHNTEGHGNAWWLQNTLFRYIDEPVLVLTTDNITEIDLDFINSQYIRCGEPVCMIVPTNPISGVSGDFIIYDNHTVRNITRENRSDRYCTGIQVINPKKFCCIFDNKLVDDFYDVWNGLITIEQLHASDIYPYHWFSVDTLEQLAEIS